MRKKLALALLLLAGCPAPPDPYANISVGGKPPGPGSSGGDPGSGAGGGGSGSDDAGNPPPACPASEPRLESPGDAGACTDAGLCEMARPDGGPLSLLGVWAADSGVYVVGQSAAGGAIHRYDGQAWRCIPASTQMALHAVRGSSAGTVWAVGDGGTALRLGTESAQQTPTPTSVPLLSVAVAGDQAWASGAVGTVLHWDGTAWGKQATSSSANLSGVWAESESVGWAVGGSPGAGVLLKRSGTSWSQKASLLVPLNAVWASGGQAFAVGEGGAIFRFSGLIAPMQSPTSRPLLSVWGSSASDVWAVGRGGALLHFDGLSWRALAGPPEDLTGVWGSSTGEVWVVSASGRVYRRR